MVTTINERHGRVEMRAPFFSGQFAGHLPSLGSNPAAFGLVGIIELLSLAHRLLHTAENYPIRTGEARGTFSEWEGRG